jgi:hypothetical protein
MRLVEAERTRNMSTYDETICGTTGNEGRLNSTKIKGNIGDLLDDIPVLVALIVIFGVECIHLSESRCKSLLRTHVDSEVIATDKPDPARKHRSLSLSRHVSNSDPPKISHIFLKAVACTSF